MHLFSFDPILVSRTAGSNNRKVWQEMKRKTNDILLAETAMLYLFLHIQGGKKRSHILRASSIDQNEKKSLVNI